MNGEIENPTLPTSTPAPKVRLVSPDDVAGARSDYQLLDIRSMNAYQQTRISGAMLLAETDQQPVSATQNAIPVVVCETGRSALTLANEWSEQSDATIGVLDGGMRAWVQSGHEVVKGDSTPIYRLSDLERGARSVLGFIVLVGSLLAFIHRSWIFVPLCLGASMMLSALFNFCGTKPLLAKLKQLTGQR